MKGRMELWLERIHFDLMLFQKNPLMLISQRKKIDNLKNSLLLDRPVILFN